MDCGALSAALSTFSFLLLLLAVVILVVLSCSVRRKSVCLECYDGRPGLYSPVDLLHYGPHRLIYAVIFGAMSNQFLLLALGPSGESAFCTSSTNPYGQAFCSVVVGNVLLVLLLCLLYGPLFACVNTSRPLLGHITGLLYLLLLIATGELLNGALYGGCGGVPYDKVEVAFSLLSSVPSYIFYVILIVWFVYEIANDIVTKRTGSGILSTQRKNSYLFKYTRQLLHKKEDLPSNDDIWQRLKSFFWFYEKDFRFPLRFLAPLVVMVSLNFRLFFVMLSVAYLFSPLVQHYTNIKNGAIALGILSGLIASGMCGVLLLQFVATVHKHLKLAAQGKFKFYRKTLPSHASILASALKYGGYQIGYFVWAWLIFWVCSLVVMALIALVFVGLKDNPQYFGPKVFRYALTIAWIPAVLLAHALMCKFVFLESNTGGKFLAITNRNGFNLFSYFVFLYNGIVGFVAAIIRVLLGLLFGTLLLFRLDQNIMMDNFKFADEGHKIYLGFLYLEHTYNNPVANTFVVLLTGESDMVDNRDRQSLNRFCTKSYGTLSNKEGSVTARNRRARNRWLVAYTLINNPGLVPLRASQLETGAEGGEQTAMNDYQTLVLIPGID